MSDYVRNGPAKLAAGTTRAYPGLVVRVASSEVFVGSELAGYRIESVLGEGGMGIVYLAEQQRLGRVVALKVIAPALARSERFRERFLHETRIAASLNHPNVIPIMDAGEADGLLYIAMRYVQATDLRALLSREGPLEPDRALSLVGQVGAALDAAHATGLVHRDVKPANILIADGDHAYLTDFGLSKSTAATSGPTATGEFLGTVAYVAPEQIEGVAADHRADVYSLTCLLYECLSGATPYVRDSDLAVLWAHVDEEPPRLSATRPELGTALDAVLARGLAKRPDERYGTCAELTAAASTAMRRRTRAELPAELDALTPLTDREEELAWLRDAWRLARSGSATLVLLAGARGMGKTRVAAELAAEVHAQGATVRYVGFADPSAPSSDAVARLADVTEETLLVLDDLDAAHPSVIDQLAAFVPPTNGRSLLVLGTYRPGADSPALAGLLSQMSSVDVHELLPFDREAVTQIAALYLGGSTAELSVDTVLATTGGIPARVHEVVSEWARGEASRRLAEAADRAAMGHSDLLTAALALESNVIDLQRVEERASLYAPGGDELDHVLCPFKGLASFEMDDAHVFFGRERLVAELVARLVGSPLLGVVGPSGAASRRSCEQVSYRRSPQECFRAASGGAGFFCGRATSPCPLSTRRSRRPTAIRTELVMCSSSWISSRRRSRPAGTTRSVQPSSSAITAAARNPAAGSRWYSQFGPPSTAAAPPTLTSPTCSARTMCSSGRCSPRSCAARSSCRHAEQGFASSHGSSTPSSPTSETSRVRSRFCRRRSSSSGRSGTGARCSWNGTRRAAASGARWAGWPSAPMLG